jgi:hypothetical protein
MLDRVLALTRSVVDIAIGVVGEVIDRVRGSDESPRARAPSAASPPTATPPPATREPEHIDTEHELVAEFAEAGAEDGAGAEISVAEPWPGYSKLAASDVIDRLTVASDAERAVVALYEREHKKRKTVLAATGRPGAAP